MDTKNICLRSVFLDFLVVTIATLLASCTFHPGHISLCQWINGAPVKQLTSSPPPTVVMEDPGTIVVYQGSGCAESDKSGQEDIIKVEQSLDIPSYATNATVFLNGWHLQYLHGDHHVQGLATLIRDIELDRRTLKWQAGGLLSDDNFDDPYNWCYYYTVIAWNASMINLSVDDTGGVCDLDDQSAANFFIAENDGTTTALSSFPTFLENPDFASDKTVAVLPRGFGFSWTGGDHSLLQIAYELDHSEILVENGKKYKKGEAGDITLSPTPMPAPGTSESQVDSGYVSWDTYAIFKDNATRRGYKFGEMVSGLGGTDVGIIQPPFSILPIESHGFFGVCIGEPPGVKSQEFIIKNIPYEYAMPMLTGWELGYRCDDEHVTEIGTWIDDIHYIKSPGSSLGTLSYRLSSILRDKDGSPGHYFNHRVTVLGVKPTGSRGTASERVPDLVPYSPLGAAPAAFCRIEQGGQWLRVTIKNQGNSDTDSSKAMVTFGNTSIELDTPSIPSGGSVDLLFRVPASCFNPDCFFKINVDSDSQVNESDEGNNSANGQCLG